VSNKFEERASKMTKSAIEKLLADVKDGFTQIVPEYKAALDNRLAELTPKKNAEYPEQAELFKVIEERDALNDRIAAMQQEALDGGYSYRTEIGGRLRNTGRASRGGNGPAGMRNTGKGKQQVMVITTDGQEFTKWVDAARHHGISPERMIDPDKRDKTNWRTYLIRAGKGGTVRFLDTEGGQAMKATYEAEGWLDGSDFEIVE